MEWPTVLNPTVLHDYVKTQNYAYCGIAAVALLLYETCVTFEREYKHIWRRNASAATWIFTFNRYLVIALYAFLVPGAFTISDARFDPNVFAFDDSVLTVFAWDSCPPLVRIWQVLNILPYVVWAAFSSLRAFALLNRAWHISLLIAMLSLAPVWIYIVSTPIFMPRRNADGLEQYRDVHQFAENFPPPTNCIAVPKYSIELDRHLTVVARVCLILSDILVLCVTWTKTYGIVRLAREHGVDRSLSVSKVLLRDGSTYFTVWTILNTLHIVGTYVQSVQYLTTFTEAFTSILVSRFILNLREVASAPSPEDEDDPTTDAYWNLVESWRVADRFPGVSIDVTSLLAPLGAPLDHSFASYESGDEPIGAQVGKAADTRLRRLGVNEDFASTLANSSSTIEMPVVAKVYIVRHGETEENRQGIMQGQLDTPLNAAGVRQAELAADALADVPFGAAYSSDLQRARKYMGDWQGKLIGTRGNPPANLEPIITFMARAMKWWNDTIARHVQRRAAQLKALGPTMEDDQDGREFEPVHILVVSHGGLIGTLVTNLVGSRKVVVAEGVEIGRCFNASISVVDVEESGKGVLVSYADTTHLNMELLQENADVQ
ncbi:hypothetical protein ACG7TL_003109 [Trametes sanguinea]